MHTHNSFQFSINAERRLVFATPNSPDQPDVPRTLEAAVNSDEVRNLLENPDVLVAASQLRRGAAEDDSRGQVARLSSSSEVRITVEPGDSVDIVLSRGRNPDGNPGQNPDTPDTPDSQNTPDSTRLIGEGLEVSPEEQRFLLRVEDEYREAFYSVSRLPDFNLAEFKQAQIARLGSRVSNNTKFQLNPGIPGSFGLGLHTEAAPYQEPTPEQTRALRGIEERYNSALRAELQSNGNQPLPPQQLIAFKQRQIAQFNQELGQTDTPIRLHMGIPESYSFGVDWAGADATVPLSEVALIGTTEGPDEDLQAEIDRELSEPGMTQEKLREQTASELADNREEATGLGEDIATAETDLAGLTTKEEELQAAIDDPEEGADIEDLERQLREVKDQKTGLEGRLGDMQARLTDLEENIIPRLERKLSMLSEDPEGEGEYSPQLSEEQRVALDAKVQELLGQLDPTLRESLGEFTVGTTPDGEPALIVSQEEGSALWVLAGDDGYITLSEISRPVFMEQLIGILEDAQNVSDISDDDMRNILGAEPAGPGLGPEGVPEGLQDIIDQTQDGLTDYLQHTEDFIRRRVAMFRAHVKGTQQEIDDANGFNVFDWDRQSTLKTTLQQEQQSLDQALDALSKIDSVRAQVGAKIEESKDTSKTGDERIAALQEGRQIAEGLRGLIQDVNYSEINKELAEVDATLAGWEAFAASPGVAVEGIGDYLGQIPGAASDIWNQDIVPAWNKNIQPYVDQGFAMDGEEWASFQRNVSDLNQYIMENGIDGVTDDLLNTYGQDIEQSLISWGMNSDDARDMRQTLENGLRSTADYAESAREYGNQVVFGNETVMDALNQMGGDIAVVWNENVQPLIDQGLDTSGPEWQTVEAAVTSLGEYVNGFDVGDLVPDEVQPLIDTVQGSLTSIPNIDLGTVDQMMNSITSRLNIGF